MPRRPRHENITPGIPNHIMLRGNNKRRLFSYPDDYKTFLRLLEHASRTLGCSVHGLCLMTNHVHELPTPPSVEAASEFVKETAQRYAQIRNARRRGSGKLFEQRYKSKPIADEKHLVAATVYIEANPIRAGLVTDPLKYPWSTYALHAGFPAQSAIPRSLWTPSDWYLSLGDSAQRRASIYREMFADYVARDAFPESVTEFEDVFHYRVRELRPDRSRAAENAFASGSGRRPRR